MEVKPQLKIKITKSGTGFHCFIPKSLIETKVLKEGVEYLATIEAINGGVFQSNFSYINITNNNVGVAL